MAQKRYYSIVSVVAIFSLLFAMRKYYTTYAYSSAIFVVTGVLGILTVCLIAFGILALLNHKNQFLITLGVVLATCISLFIWLFYWIDVSNLIQSISDIYWNGSLVDFDYTTTAISGIVEIIGVCIFYFMGCKISDNQSMNENCEFPFYSGLFLCGLFLIASIDRPLYYISIAIIGGVLLTFLYFLQIQKNIFHYVIGILSLICLLFFILDLAIRGAEPNFVFITGIAYSVLYAIVSFSKSGKKFLVSKDVAQKIESNYDFIQRLENLKKLHEAKILTDEEFQTEKEKILGEKKNV